jgi:hypothetical protein
VAVFEKLKFAGNDKLQFYCLTCEEVSDYETLALFCQQQ